MRRRKFSELRDELSARPGGAEALERAREVVRSELSLAELRKAREYTQEQLASALETTQPGISRIEHQADIYLSTLRSYVEALGGRLELRAIFRDTEVAIASLERLDESIAERVSSPRAAAEADAPLSVGRR